MIRNGSAGSQGIASVPSAPRDTCATGTVSDTRLPGGSVVHSCSMEPGEGAYSSRSGARSASATARRTPESDRTCASWLPRKAVLTGTGTSPAQLAPRIASRVSKRLPAMMATRSPLWSYAVLNAAPHRATSARIPSALRVTSPTVTNGLSPPRSACQSSNLGNVRSPGEKAASGDGTRCQAAPRAPLGIAEEQRATHACLDPQVAPQPVAVDLGDSQQVGHGCHGVQVRHVSQDVGGPGKGRRRADHELVVVHRPQDVDVEALLEVAEHLLEDVQQPSQRRAIGLEVRGQHPDAEQHSERSG